MVELSAKDRRIAKMKAEGKKLKEIAAVEYPKAKPRSGEVLVSRVLKKEAVAQYYDKELSVLLNEHGVTKNQYIENIGKAMKAEKMNQFTGEVYDDHGTRLAANKQAERFLKFDDPPTHELIEGMETMDTVELSRVVFSKTPPKQA